MLKFSISNLISFGEIIVSFRLLELSFVLSKKINECTRYLQFTYLFTNRKSINETIFQQF